MSRDRKEDNPFGDLLSSDAGPSTQSHGSIRPVGTAAAAATGAGPGQAQRNVFDHSGSAEASHSLDPFFDE